MEITEVRIKLVPNSSERLRAFCSVTFCGGFVVRDLKIIGGINGVFVAMPSRKLTDRCPRCGCKNHLRARFCNECGVHLRENRAPKDNQGRAKLHADIAHPINAACREQIQKAVVEAYEQELERSKLPDYQPQSFDDFDDYDSDLGEMETAAVGASSSVTQSDSEDRPHKEQFSEYNSLIEELKRDAAERRSSSSSAVNPSRLPPAEGENPLGKPAYVKRQNAKPAEPPMSMPAPAQDDSDSFGEGLV